MYNDKLLAESTPRQLVWNTDFWRRQALSMPFLLFVAIAYLSLLKFALPIGGDWFSWLFTAGIIAVLLLGIWQIALSIPRLEIESAYFSYVEAESNKLLKRAYKGENPNIHNLRQSVLLNNPVPSCIAQRLFKHILSEAEGSKFESAIVSIQPFREEISLLNIKVAEMQKASLHLGIVGTFIGLIMAFQQDSAAGGSMQNILDGSVLSMIDALKFAFTTSVAGLLNALALGLLLKIPEKKQETIAQKMEGSAVAFLNLARIADNDRPATRDLEAMKERVELLYDRVLQQNNAIHDQTRAIQHGLSAIAETKREFQGILQQLADREANFLSEIKGTYDYFSPKTISGNLNENLEVVVQNITEVLRQNLEKTLTQYDQMSGAVRAMTEHLGHLDAQLKKQYEETESTVGKSKKEIFESLEAMSKAQSRFVEQITAEHVGEDIKKGILQAGEQIAQRYKTALEAMLPHVQKLGKEIEDYNQITRDELANRTLPAVVFQFVKLIFQTIQSTIHYLIRLVPSRNRV